MALIDDLISWWSLDEASGTRYDSHGSYHLTDNNTVGSTTGKIGNAATMTLFPSEYLSNSTVIPPSTIGSFTVAGWFRISDYPLFNDVRFLSDGGPWFRVMYTLGGYICFGNFHLESSASVSPGEWNFIATWYNSSTGTLGLRVNNTVDTRTSSPSGSPSAFTIGSADNGDTTTIDADEVAYWSRVLSSSELDQVFNSDNGVSYADIAGGDPDPAIGSGTLNTIAGATIVGYRRSLASGILDALGNAVVDGRIIAVGSGEINTIANADVTGHRSSQGSGELNIIADATIATYITASGYGELDTVADAAITGYVATSGSGTLATIAGALVAGYVASTGSGTLDVIADGQADGYIVTSGSGELGAIADAITDGYITATGAGTLDTIADAIIVAATSATVGSGVLDTIAGATIVGYAASRGAGELDVVADAEVVGERDSVGSGALGVVAGADVDGYVAAVGWGVLEAVAGAVVVAWVDLPSIPATPWCIDRLQWLLPAIHAGQVSTVNALSAQCRLPSVLAAQSSPSPAIHAAQSYLPTIEAAQGVCT